MREVGFTIDRMAKKQRTVKDYALLGVALGALAIYVFISAADEKSDGGDAGIGFVIGGALALVALVIGVMVAVAKGNELSNKD